MGERAAARRLGRPSLRRRHGVAAMAVIACCALTGCAADFGAQTNQQYQPGVGTDDRGHTVFVLNLLVVADTNGEGTLVGTLINQAKAADALVSVTAEDSKGNPITTTSLAKPIPLDPQAAVKLQTGGAIRLSGSGLVLGDIITVAFSFQQAAPFKEQIPVVLNGPDYSGIPVGPTTPSGSSGSTPPATTSTSTG